MKNKTIDFEKISTYQTPNESPGYLLWRVSTQWRSSIEKTLESLNLTHPQFVILAVTAWHTRNNEKASQIDISNRSSLDPNTTSQILRTLESKKLIKRLRSINERSKNPILTTLGSDILKKALPAVEQTDKLFFDSLSMNESKELITIFKKLLSIKE